MTPGPGSAAKRACSGPTGVESLRHARRRDSVNELRGCRVLSGLFRALLARGATTRGPDPVATREVPLCGQMP